MIGNTVEFLYIDYGKPSDQNSKTIEGIVVDAYTVVTDKSSGKYESFLGFGSGESSGNIKSVRKFIIMYYEDWDVSKNNAKFTEIELWKIKKIISFATTYPKESIEKFMLKEDSINGY